MMQPERGRQIRSVKQISDDIRRAKLQFQQVLSALAVPSITLEEDLTKRTPTIETVLKDLPSEHRLREMMEHPYAETPQIRQRILSGYKGKYEIIRRAAQNIQNLKCQAQKIYYLAAQLNLYRIRNEFDPEHPQGITLKSYQVYANENLRLPRYQKNMLNPNYLRQLRQQELHSGGATYQHLQAGEPIVTLSLYDSINGEKTFEYNLHGDQTLFQAASKFYCMVAKLQGRQATHCTNSYFLIEDSFYFNGNAAKKKIEEIIAFSSQNLEEDDINVKTEPAHALYEMAKAKVKNLRVVFGRPYLFRHLEGCDHIIIFKDLHILSQGQKWQPTHKEKYPLTVFQGRMRKRKCDGCRARYADWVSLNDPLKGGKHLYLCKECHGNLHPMEKEEATCVRYIHD